MEAKFKNGPLTIKIVLKKPPKGRKIKIK
ncbi:MAG: hypothetical protein AB7D17_01465 [Methanobacteriales archaeon]